MSARSLSARWAVLGGLCLFLGCATREVVTPFGAQQGTPLVVAQSGSDVQFTWQSERGARYTVFYTDSSGTTARWRPLPGYTSLPGTGGSMSGSDRVPGQVVRRYKLDTVR